MRNTTILLAVVAVMALASSAGGTDYWWNAGTASYHTNTHWDPTGGPPDSSSDNGYIKNDGKAQISQSVTVNTLYVGAYGPDYGGGDSYGIGHAEMAAGAPGAYTFTTTNGIFVGQTLRSYGEHIDDPGTFTQYGGTASLLYTLKIGPSGSSERGNGTYTIHAGSIIQANAQYNRVNLGGGGYTPSSNGIGRFIIMGTGPTEIKFNEYIQGSRSILGIVLSAAGSVTPIQIIGTHADYGNANLEGTLELNDDAWTTKTAKVIPILTVGSGKTITNNLTFSDPDSNWSLGKSGDGLTLQLEYVPEPATLVLLSLGGIGVLLRRKKQ